MSIRYYLVDRNLPGSRDRAVLLTGSKEPFKNFLNYCEKVSTVSQADAIAVIDNMVSWIEKHASQGRKVDFGPLGQSWLGLRRSTPHDKKKRARSRKFTLVVDMQLTRQLRRRVADAVRYGEMQEVAQPIPRPNIKYVFDVTSGAKDNYAPGGVLQIRGNDLKFDPEREDEGVFLRIGPRRQETRVERYLVVYPKSVDAWLPSDGLGGPRQLVIRRRIKPSDSHTVETVYSPRLQEVAP